MASSPTTTASRCSANSTRPPERRAVAARSALARKPRDFADAADRLSPADFRRLTAHIHAVCGITISQAKSEMLEGRLRRRVRALGLDSLRDYAAWLFEGGALDEEGPALINAVTTNKTDFFREPAHFAFLREVVLPELSQRRRPLRVWSAACSTGAEPYTLAMVLDAHANDADGPEFGILATDIDTEVLAHARRGVYPLAQLDPVPAELRRRYVMRARLAGRNEGRITPDLRAAVGFGRLNLIGEGYPVGEPMDVIFCRNVLIYFDRETQARVVAQLADCLRPGGYLFLGHSEAGVGASPALASVACAVYRKH
ncbi:MAG: protein-glutamate O-methyltransferase [Sphingomonadales bacterium]|nr:protein-glutamate O-methyltransferase [Sphingomonadales bacterium]